MELIEINQKIKKIKPENLHLGLHEELVQANPFEQFLLWFNQALDLATFDPSAMVLATVDEQGLPDTRVVLLKELENQRFIFYTSYESKKAKDLAHAQVAALNFYWPECARQIRIRGRVEKIARAKTELYFSTRAREAQLGTHAWIQSSKLTSKDELANRIKIQADKFKEKTVTCPESWGGYALMPFEYEFFQRGLWRVHDRVQYSLTDNSWTKVRLAP